MSGWLRTTFHVYLLCVWQPEEAGITEIGKFLLKTKSSETYKQQQQTQQLVFHVQNTITQLLKQATLPFSASSKSRASLKASVYIGP